MNLSDARKTGNLEAFQQERESLCGDTDAIDHVIKASEKLLATQATSKQATCDD